MDEILSQLGSLIPENFDSDAFLTALIGLTAGSIILGLIGRYAFGKRSVLQCSVSSAIGILFLYAVTIVLYSAGIQRDLLVAPLPFVTISGDYMSVFSFAAADYVQICGQLLNMIILAFLVNIADCIFPKKKNIKTIKKQN